MKRLILVLTISLSLTSVSSFASDIIVSDAALSSFKTTFTNATDVNWSTFNEFYKVSFVLHDEYVTAYYNKEGQRIALTRNISAKQLPFTLQVSIKNDYENYWISDLFEMNNNEEGTSYYITLENASSKIVLKSSSMLEWMTFKKFSK